MDYVQFKMKYSRVLLIMSSVSKESDSPRVVMRDLPLSVFPYVNKRISALHLISSSAHGEFVNARVLTPVVPNGCVALQDLAPGPTDVDSVQEV